MPPFFVVGSARSGTTLLRVILNAHPEVAVPPESRFVTELWTGAAEVDVSEFLARLTGHRQFQGWSLSVDEVAAEFAGLARVGYRGAIEATYHAYTKAQGKTRWGDKTPRYVLSIPFLSELFPESRFVHLVRDGRNVALSYAGMPFGPKTAPKVAALWSKRVLAGVRDGRPLGEDRYREVRYEDLVSEPESHVRKLCTFLDLPFVEAMMDYTEKGREITFDKASTYNPHVFEPPQTGVRSWETEMPNGQVKLFEAIAGEVLQMFGYPRRYPALGPATKVAASLGRMGAPVGRLRKEGQ